MYFFLKFANTPNFLRPLACLSCALVAGCDWVDSAGTTGAAAGQPPPAANVQLFAGDEPLNDQSGGNVYSLNEKSSIRIVTQLADELAPSWSDEPVEQGRLPGCVASGFEENASIADSLEQACTDIDNCNLDFELQSGSDEQAEFILRIPVLKSSVGVAYELEINDISNEPVVERYDFCLIAVNESPDPLNDSFVVLEGQRLEVTASGRNLLSNDTDDIDDTNRPLRVLEEPVSGPAYAALFELGSDGSFVYESSLTGMSADAVDSFVYQVTDGVTPANSAVATIRIVVTNRAPVLVSQIPLIEATVGSEFEEDLSDYFSDPDRNEISFSVSADSVLPPSGSVSLTSDGVLGGLPETGDSGTYVIGIVASDGVVQNTDEVVNLSIAPIPLINSAPRYVSGTVVNRTVRVNRRMPAIEPQFIDDDGDALNYSMFFGSRLPRGVSLDPETGVISGIPVQEGYFGNLRVVATDTAGISALSDSFNIRVNP